MLEAMLPVAGIALTVFGGGFFGYLRYRAYTTLIRHVVDECGGEAAPVVRSIRPPGIDLTNQPKPPAGELQGGTGADVAA